MVPSGLEAPSGASPRADAKRAFSRRLPQSRLPDGLNGRIGSRLLVRAAQAPRDRFREGGQVARVPSSLPLERVPILRPHGESWYAARLKMPVRSLALAILLAVLLEGSHAFAQEDKKTDDDKPADPDTDESTVEEKTLGLLPNPFQK